MFLNQLGDEEKVTFLEIAHHLAWGNDDFSDKERAVIDGYCNEMRIKNIEFNNATFNLEKTLAKITSPRNQKIVFLEIMALILAEHLNSLETLHVNERKILDTIANAFDITPTMISIYMEWTKAVLSLSTQGAALLEL